MTNLILLIIYILGVIFCIWCVIDVWKHKIGFLGKILLTIVLLCCSWVGFIVYYLIVRRMLRK